MQIRLSFQFLSLILATSTAAAAPADSIGSKPISVHLKAYSQFLDAVRADYRYVNEADAHAVDGILAEQRRQHRLDDVYHGFRYLFDSERAALREAGVVISPLTPLEEFRVKKMIDHIALASRRKLVQEKFPQTEQARRVLSDTAVVEALMQLQSAIVAENAPETAVTKGETLALALLGAISKERPSDLLVFDAFVRHVRPAVAEPLKPILREERQEARITEFVLNAVERVRRIELELPKEVVEKWSRSTWLQRAGTVTRVAAAIGLSIYVIREHGGPSVLGDKLASFVRNTCGYLALHPGDEDFKKYGHSSGEDYLIGFRMYARRMRDAIESFWPGFADLPGIPMSEPNRLVRAHGYIGPVCRDIFLK